MMDFPYTLTSVAAVTKGKLLESGQETTVIREYLIDSRKLVNPAESLFIALVSKRNDGHNYIRELYEKGVRCFLVSKLPSPENDLSSLPGAGFVLVDDTLEALQRLSAFHRSQFNIPVIGITGSNGKTIIKEWLYQLMSPDKSIIRSPKSFNSQIGVPLSVLKMEPGNEMAIFEAGISQSGEMERLEPIIHPAIGIFTNIGQAHSENFTSMESKVKEKLILFRNSDVLIYCKDHADIVRIVSDPGCFDQRRTFTWGRTMPADLLLTGITQHQGQTEIKGVYKGGSSGIMIPFTDYASIENAVHCWALMLWLNYDQNVIRERMAALVPIAMRLELKEGINHCSVINDSYNSDINSLGIAIDFLNQQKQHDRKTLILSDILQSGKNIDDLYREIAGIISGTGISRVIGIGRDISAQSDKFSGEKIFFETTDDFLGRFPVSAFRDETILLKGARTFEFEKISRILELKVHETVLEINLDAVVHNLNYYRSKLGSGIKTMVMVKAFSYGSGSFEIASLLQFHHASYLAVAYADEGVELRKAGITLPVMVMNPEKESFDLLFEYQLEPEVYNFRILGQLEDAIAQNSFLADTVKFHIKLDTGMHRLGFEPQDIDELIDRIRKNPKLHVQSVFSHLAASEDPAQDDFTRSQIRQLDEMAERIADKLPYPFFKHILNSAGITRFPEAQMDMVRLGIGLYGVGFDESEQKKLKNVSTLKSVISQIKEVKANETVGYSRRGVAQRDSVIAVVPIGYADGLNRRLSNGVGRLFVHGSPAPVIGNISMDTCMIDITAIVTGPGAVKVNEGDEVIIFGDEYLLENMAQDLGTIPYEILTNISRRVKRVYFYE
jgi:Alr-MurF fusion protein